MPIRITCSFGSIADRVDDLLPDLGKTASGICSAFSAAAEHITLVPRATTPNHSLPEVKVASLQFRLEEVLDGTPVPGLSGTSDIGLLFADRFKGDDSVLGVMFDAGGNSTGDPDYDAIPRQGAAVFVGAIAGMRDAADVAQEVLFTAVHELGHVFNLWHVPAAKGEDAPEFADHLLASSEGKGKKPFARIKFLDRHREFLSWCAESACVRPGGYAFGVRDDLGPTTSTPTLSAFGNSVALSSAFPQREFHPFEPMELELEAASAAPGQPATVLDRMDPAFDETQVWVTSPSGRRRRFDPGMRLCAVENLRTLDAARPMRRDVTLYLQRGRHLFDEAGEHRIDAFFRLPNGDGVRSATLPVHVLSSERATPRLRNLRSAMTHPESVRVLATRQAAPSSSAFKRLHAVCGPKQKDPTVGGLAYVLARAAWPHGRRKGRSSQRTRAVAQRLFEQAARSLPESTHRHRKAVALLDGHIEDPDDRWQP